MIQSRKLEKVMPWITSILLIPIIAYILLQLGLLDNYQAAGNLFFGLSIITFCIALIIPILLKEPIKSNIELNL
jgi:hypothetical protein